VVTEHLGVIPARRRILLSKFIRSTLPLLSLLFFLAGTRPAQAQTVDMYFGLGSATNGATTSAGCAPKFVFDNITGACENSPTMGGTFGVIGGDVMLWHNFGINVEDSFRFATAPFLPAAGINVRPSFYDFNAVYQPGPAEGRIVPVISGGIGGAKLSFYENQQVCAISSVCINQNAFITSSNHFQVHGAVGVKFYVKSSMFIKPQIDFHYVPNLNQQYGSNFVPQYTISIGYTFGR
jgi:hypothetical protein